VVQCWLDMLSQYGDNLMNPVGPTLPQESRARRREKRSRADAPTRSFAQGLLRRDRGTAVEMILKDCPRPPNL
jgi:hypothetical protein